MAAKDNLVNPMHHEMPAGNVAESVTSPKHMAAEPPVPAYGTTVQPGASNLLEYVSGRPSPRIARYIEATPQWIDDLTRDLGTDLYERMLNDSQCFSCVETVKLAVLAEGWRINPAIKDKKSPDYSVAKEMAEFCERNLDYLASGSTPMAFEQWSYEMLDAVAIGNKISEKVCAIHESGKDAGKLCLSRLKTKHRKTYSYVVDAFLNVLGVIAVIPGRSYIIYQGTSLFDPDKLPNIIPRDKFCCFAFNPRNADPRGSSILRPAYDPWWTKQNAKRELLKYLAQFGTPNLWGRTSPESTAQSKTDYLGNPTGQIAPTPEQSLLFALQGLRSGGCAVVPPGADINLLQANAEAQILSALDYYDKQIAKAITSQVLATEEGQHQTRAAGAQHRDILDMVISHVRKSFEAMVKQDLFHFLIRYNYGEVMARLYTPDLNYGRAEKEDWPTTVSSVMSMVAAGYLAPSQVSAMDEKLGLPDRTDKSQFEVATEQSQQPAPQPVPQEEPGQPPANEAAPLTSWLPSNHQEATFSKKTPVLLLDRSMLDPAKRSRLAHVNDNMLKCGRVYARSFGNRHARRLLDGKLEG